MESAHKSLHGEEIIRPLETQSLCNGLLEFESETVIPPIG